MQQLFFQKLWPLFVLAMIWVSAQSPSCETSSPSEESVFPLAVGNTWIFEDSLFRNGQLMAVFADTLKVLDRGRFNNQTTFLLSDGKELMWQGDTLFQIVMQRGGYRFATTYFLRHAQEISFHYAYGGDVVVRRTAEPLKTCLPYAKALCYRVSDLCTGEMVLAAGVGIVRWRLGHCFAEAETVIVKTLKHYVPAHR